MKVLNVFQRVFLAIVFSFSFLSLGAVSVNAQEENVLCDLFPFLNDIGGGDGGVLCGTGDADQTINEFGNFIRFALSLVFVGIIGVAVFYIIKSAIKYIRSEGKEDEVQNAQKAIKSVFIGVAALFVGIIGLVIILIFFNSTGALSEGETGDRPEIVDRLLDGQ